VMRNAMPGIRHGACQIQDEAGRRIGITKK
jgi:hypothetical protein